jgi:3-oxoacyl-[acyl-carrier protein] reductase
VSPHRSVEASPQPGAIRGIRRVVLITGAAGGLGRGLVEAFAREGWRVAAGWHETRGPGETDSIWPVALDVTDQAQGDEAVAGIVQRWGRLDALINTAGLAEDHLLARMSEADWDRVLEVNLKGAFLCAQAVARQLIHQRDGHILNIASYAARSGAAGQSAYAAAKAGLLGLTASLAKELGSRNVRVNAVLPGVLPTAMTAGLARGALDRFAQANALGRLNAVDEVARFVVFLAGLRNVSGQIFQLDSRIARWT